MESIKHAYYSNIRAYLGDNYRESDEYIISLYMDTHALYVALKEQLKNEDIIIKDTDEHGQIRYKKNPLIKEVLKYSNLLVSLLNSLGMTPNKR